MSETFEVSRRTCFSQFFFHLPACTTLIFFLMNIWLPPSLLPCELHNSSPRISFDKTAKNTRVKNIFYHNRYSRRYHWLLQIYIIYNIKNRSFNKYFIHKILKTLLDGINYKPLAISSTSS